MIARAYIFLPYAFDIPDGAMFGLPRFEAQPYSFTLQLPVAVPELDHSKQEIWVGEHKTYRGRALVIDFHSSSFNRRVGEKADPPVEDIFQVANWLLQRLRLVLRAPHVSPLDTDYPHWHVRYLSDDGAELPE